MSIVTDFLALILPADGESGWGEWYRSNFTKLNAEAKRVDGELVRVAGKVDARLKNNGAINLGGVERTTWPAAGGTASSLNDVVQNGASANLPATATGFRINDSGGNPLLEYDVVTGFRLGGDMTEAMQSGSIKFALDQARLANDGVKSLNRINQQQGEFTLYNAGVVSGCVLSITGVERKCSITAGVCFIDGRKYYVPAQNSYTGAPYAGAGGLVVYLYLALVNGIPRLEITPNNAANNPSIPVGMVPLASLTLPADSADAALAGATISARICPTESNYPISVDSPVTYTVPLINVLPDTNYTIEFEVLSSTGSPCDERSLKVTTRNTNNFIVTLCSAADDVVVRWKLSRLNGIAEHPVNDWRARFAANPNNPNYPTSSAY